MQTRKSNRLKEFNYSQTGSYFITICTANNENLFWKDVEANVVRQSTNNKQKCVEANIVRQSTKNKQKCVGANIVRQSTKNGLTQKGNIVLQKINKIDKIYQNKATVDKYVIMPNHVHLIITIHNDEKGRTMFSPTISQIIKQFKGAVTKEIAIPIWQRSFHDHIIRNQYSYDKIWKYIDANPIKWEEDCYFNQS